ncbi:MAG: RNA polymerase sigma-E factor [Candidatus Roizmanbacteria bacterium GW2011_GWA2_35_19]|uniref:RNA polymerase sigma-E factor n=2 Tax=Candidatus Roizmaniibacteriota TaxID=1752723 RepID=A0A0G0BQP7_9BACT|nr:MAG: RNA polymerase sigma-E factor [Candidatus Roizmanbacteria bacterium GW2011_GWC2_35_12]KKP71713.1 MAG: RNA polymerase sigma-E factor [Candidatus Roizmanbacteria bacterium GW2011_GWA2_35_19]
METPDIEAIMKVKNGELDYYGVIVKKYTNKVYHYISKKSPTYEDAEDLTQISLIKFFKSLKNFDTKRKVLPYLYQIAKNELKMFYRSRKQHLQLKEEFFIEEKQEVEKTDYLLETVSKKERKIIEMLSHGYTYQEVAVKIKKPLNTVKSIVRRAKIKIRKSKNNL